MQWLIKWEELTTRSLLHNGVATPSFNKLSASQKVEHLRDHFDMLLSFEYSGFIRSEVSEYVSLYSKDHSSENVLQITEFARIFSLCLCFSLFFSLKWFQRTILYEIISIRIRSFVYTYTDVCCMRVFSSWNELCENWNMFTLVLLFSAIRLQVTIRRIVTWVDHRNKHLRKQRYIK